MGTKENEKPGMALNTIYSIQRRESREQEKRERRRIIAWWKKIKRKKGQSWILIYIFKEINLNSIKTSYIQRDSSWK